MADFLFKRNLEGVYSNGNVRKPTVEELNSTMGIVGLPAAVDATPEQIERQLGKNKNVKKRKIPPVKSSNMFIKKVNYKQ